MNKPELEEKIQSVFSFAEGEMGKSGGYSPMMEIVFKMNDDKLGANVVLLGDNGIMEQRFKFAKGLGSIFGYLASQDKLKGIECFLMSSEAWMSHTSKEQYKAGMMPRNDPNKIEVLMVSGQTLGGDVVIRNKQIVRTGKVNGKEFFSLNEMSSSDGGLGGDGKFRFDLAQDFYEGYNKVMELKARGHKFSPIPDTEPLEKVLPRLLDVLVKQLGLNGELLFSGNKN